MTQIQAHGFVWPDGMPACLLCDRDPNDPVHVTPAHVLVPQILAADSSESKRNPVQSHSYAMAIPDQINRIPCVACGQLLNNGVHAVGLPSGAMPWGEALLSGSVYTPATLAREVAFVAEIGHRLVFAAPATTKFDPDQLPRQIASTFQKASDQNPNNLWIAGRYVEADRPNRNAAYWSTEDLEVGAPSVSHGPINWLHDERHVIGAIADSELVHVDREVAASTGVGNHIVALGALWPYLPQARTESQIVQRASDNGKLWFSMECVSREVACLTCDQVMSYPDYMTYKDQRCGHMQDKMPRRFVDPTFGGAGIIVPPVSPGWTQADARVLMPQAAALAERQAASFTGMTTTEAELTVAEILLFAGLSEEREKAAKYSAEQLRDMLKKGHAIRNDAGEPSYPIGDRADLDNAIKAVGRGGISHDDIRSYIKRRAKDLGAEGMIPEGW